MKNNYEEWTKEFLESWRNLDYQRTLKTLDPNVVYYENPIDAPCKNFDEVTALWNIVATNQKEIDYQYDIICCDEKFCIVHFQMTRIMTATNKKQWIDGIFQISLNDKNQCTYFKQWRFTREEN